MSVYVCVCHRKVFFIEIAAWIKLIVGYRFHSVHATLCFREIWISPKIRVLPLNFIPNFGLRKFHHGQLTVSESYINSDCGRSVVYNTWRR